MLIAEIAILVLFLVGLLSSAKLSGQPKIGKHSFLVDLSLNILMLVLLYFAGAFSAILLHIK